MRTGRGVGQASSRGRRGRRGRRRQPQPQQQMRLWAMAITTEPDSQWWPGPSPAEVESAAGQTRRSAGLRGGAAR